MDKSKNILIGILVCVILVLSCVIVFTLGAKSNNNDNLNIDNNNEESVKNYIEENEEVPYITISGFETENQEIKNFYSSNKESVNYEYHVSNDILFINIQKDVLHGQEGIVTYLNYYIDLNNNKGLSTQKVLEVLNVNMNDFNLQCTDCSLSTLDNNVRLMPVGGLLFVEPLEMGTFNSFRVSYNK